MKHYGCDDEHQLGSGGTRTSCDAKWIRRRTSSSDALESVSAWTQPEVAVSSARGEHEVTVQLVVQSHWTTRGADGRCESRGGDERDAEEGHGGGRIKRDVRVFGTCKRRRGSRGELARSHKCAAGSDIPVLPHPERSEVPVVHEQVHAMVRIGYRSVKCRMPHELDATSRDECPFLSERRCHLSADGV